MTHEDVSVGSKKCPYCAETIQAEAIKRRYCHSDLPNNAPKVTTGTDATGKTKLATGEVPQVTPNTWLAAALALFALAAFILVYGFFLMDRSQAVPYEDTCAPMEVYAGLCEEPPDPGLAFPTAQVVWGIIFGLAGFVPLSIWIISKGVSSSSRFR